MEKVNRPHMRVPSVHLYFHQAAPDLTVCRTYRLHVALLRGSLEQLVLRRKSRKVRESNTTPLVPFRIYLPLINLKVMETSADRVEESPMRGTETILVAEDYTMVRILAMAVLPEFGYTVIKATDGKDAVRKFMENMELLICFSLTSSCQR